MPDNGFFPGQQAQHNKQHRLIWEPAYTIVASNLGPKGIRVNLISAGPYASRAARAIGEIDHMIKYAADRSPLPRGIEPEEVANAAVFLSSPLASAITGHILYVDCG